MTECSLSHKLEGPPPRDEQGPVSDTKDTSHPLYGKTVVMTGFRDRSLEEQLKALGSKIGASVNKQTFALFVKNREETSGKRQQAETLNIPIYTLEEFKAQYNI
jgi:NAD-dependent DNA ligase